MRCFSDNDAARGQSALIAAHSSAGHWCERLPDWTGWTDSCRVTQKPLISTLVDAPLVRHNVKPSPSNGLRQCWQLMADKLLTVPTAAIEARDRSGGGALDAGALAELDLALRSRPELP